MRTVRFVRLHDFVWVPVVAALVLGLSAMGAPYVIWSYDFRAASMASAPRVYTRCTYVGVRGTITDYPGNGRCGWVRFGHPTGGF